MIFLIWCLNAVFSFFNARFCGNVWDASKAKGGIAHFMTWMGVVMAASGFTWCLFVMTGIVLSGVPMNLIDEEVPPEVMILAGEDLEALFNLGYTVVIFPILGSGLAITVQTWRDFVRNKDRGVGDYAITGWNTYAQVSNTYSAVQHLPGVLDSLGSYFGGSSSSSSSSSSDKGKLIIPFLIAMCVVGGILITYGIVQSRRRAVIYEEYNLARGYGAP